jgi:hypothetical protein
MIYPVSDVTFILNIVAFKVAYMTVEGIPVTGRGGPYGCEMSELPHFLDNQLTDGGEVVSLTRQEDSWYSFLLEAE